MEELEKMRYLLTELRSQTNVSGNNYEIQNINPNYQLMLLTFYNAICNNLNDMVGDVSTINNIHKMIDKELNDILKLANMKIIKINSI